MLSSGWHKASCWKKYSSISIVQNPAKENLNQMRFLLRKKLGSHFQSRQNKSVPALQAALAWQLLLFFFFFSLKC